MNTTVQTTTIFKNMLDGNSLENVWDTTERLRTQYIDIPICGIKLVVDFLPKEITVECVTVLRLK